MRHGKSHRKLNRSPSHRRAMLRNMATSMIEHERIETTLPKAKDLRGVVERLITIAGEDTLHRRRKAYSYLQSKKVVHKLFTEVGPRYKERPGGYTRVFRTRVRAGDAAPMAIIELVQEDYKPKAKKKRSTSKKKPKKEQKQAAKAEEEEQAADLAESEEVKTDEAPAAEEQAATEAEANEEAKQEADSE